MSNIKIPWRIAFRTAIDWLYPPCCPFCGQPDTALCRHCEEELVSGGDRAICRQMAGLNGFWASGIHEDLLREAIHALKFGGVQTLVAPMGERLWRAWRDARLHIDAGPDIDAALAVPLHEARLAERGFNQSELLTQALAERAALPVQTGWLWRQRDTRSQVGLGARERARNVSNAFQASGAVAGKRLLLIDDVATSGATLMACARSLRAAGALAVFALTVSTTNWQMAGAGYRQDADFPYNAK